jgi:acetolactate synthase I/II/III large subunit
MTQSNSVTVAEGIAIALKRHGVEYVFAQSLPSAVILAAEAIGIRQIAYRQENMGGAMADGYARVSGRISVHRTDLLRPFSCRRSPRLLRPAFRL